MLIGRELGHEMKILDLGGGFPAGEISDSLLEALKFSNPSASGIDYTVFAEPGRHICA